ncbi:MetS family NSS transporter small subunit [Pseudodesulfovibrio tunisiensis]|nr:MetS family NSS transporter small subunit [Pseudodesulfovibrio tunisiensis]
MSIESILMMAFGLTLTWGGASLCIRRALKGSPED